MNNLIMYIFFSIVVLTKLYVFNAYSFIDTSFLLGSIVMEVIPLIVFSFIRVKKRLLKVLLRSVVFIYILNFILNFIYFIESHEFVSVELLRNINIYAVLGFLTLSSFLIWASAFIFLTIGCLKISKSVLRFRFTGKALSLSLLVIMVILGNFTYQKNKLEDRSVSGMNRALRKGKISALHQVYPPSYYATINSFIQIRLERGLVANKKMPLSSDEKLWLRNNLMDTDVIQEDKVKGEKALTKIILLTMESVPLSYLSSSNEMIPQETTPFFNELTLKNKAFANFFTAGMPTDHGLASLLCSFPYFLPEMETRLSCLPQFLKEYGYSSSLFRGVSLFYGGHNLRYKKLFKFDSMFGLEEYKSPKVWGWGATDHSVLRNALDTILRSPKKKELISINLMDTHPPYYSDERTDEIESKMLKSLNTLDSNIKSFVDSLKESEVWDDTLIILTSDHSPNHGDYLKWSSVDNYEPSRLPLYFLGGSAQTKLLNTLDRSSLYSQLDLTPTILTLFPVNKRFLGSSMFKASRSKSRKHIPVIFSRKLCLQSLKALNCGESTISNILDTSVDLSERALSKLINNNFF